MNRGIVFTMDVLIGLSLLIMIVMTLAFFEFESILPEKKYERLNYLTDDIMNVLSYLQVKDVQDKPTVERLIEDGVLVGIDLDKSVLDLISSFWSAGNETIAENITREVLEGLTYDICLNLTMDGQNIYSSCDTPAKDVTVVTRIESGYEPGKASYGYIARAFLTNIKGKSDSSYAYFGGYVGDGNITRYITLYGLNKVLNATMVLDAGSDFDLYINGNYSGGFSPSPSNLTADEWIINPLYHSNLKDGNNTIAFNFTGNNSYIGGGYFKVTYSSSQMFPTTTEGIDYYYFPGIEGIINLYSSFYVPGSLNALEVYLHFKSNYETFFSIGNATIYEDNATGEETVYISDDDIKNNITSVGLSYAFLSNKTIPIRMGLSNVSYVSTIVGNADVFSVTDVSLSMEDCNVPADSSDYDCIDGYCTGGDCWNVGWLCCIFSCCDSSQSYCEDCGGTWTTTAYFKKKITVAKEANKVFVEAILNASGNRLGLVNYSTDVEHIHPLSTDNTSLKNEIDGYIPKGWTCICCGVNAAAEDLNSNATPGKFKSMVVMTDGLTNQECLEQNTGDPEEDAVQSACDAYNNYGITVHTIGFGGDVNETTLQRMAECGHGNYYYSNVSELAKIYQEVAEAILNASYVAQTVKVEGFYNKTRLYSDSYIKFNFTPIVVPLQYGEVSLTRETDKLEDCIGYVKTDEYVEGGYYLSPEVEVIDAKVTSYSSQFWTHKVDANTSSNSWQTVFQLSDFGSDYKILGDPFIVQIPIVFIQEGENNFVRVETGVNPINGTGGSPDNRVIHTMKIKGSVGYGSVFNSSSLAMEDARQRLIDKIISYVDVDEDDIEIQNETIRGIQEIWGPSLLKIIMWEK